MGIVKVKLTAKPKDSRLETRWRLGFEMEMLTGKHSQMDSGKVIQMD